MEEETAILIDGGFYRKRAHALFGSKSAELRADELERYCSLHIKDGGNRNLYRIFYYDCPPLDITLFHPLLGNVDLKRNETFVWTNTFFQALLKKRKFALRLGRLATTGNGYRLDPDAVKRLCAKKITVDELTEKDFTLEIRQKGVDMRVGIDIAHLAHKKLVTQIILIAGDSDFVPAAKVARREGIDFIIDPMKSHIANDLLEHVDGLYSHWNDKRVCPMPPEP